MTAQIALALVLLAGAGLMIKSAARLHGTGIGVDSDRVLTARIDLPADAQATTPVKRRRRRFFTQLTERIRAVPGVESVGIANCPPVSGGCSSTIAGFERGQFKVTAGMPSVGVHWATPGIFFDCRHSAAQRAVVHDRGRAERPKVVLVNETAARAFWPNADPIGKIIAMGRADSRKAQKSSASCPMSVTARSKAHRSLMRTCRFSSRLQSRMRIFVRSRLDQATLVAAIRQEVRQLDSNLPLTEVKTMEERVGDAMWRTRVAAWLFSAFAGLALLLTAVGIFGVMSQTVSQRMPEIGVRMALGAQGSDVLGLVLGRAGVLTGIGIGAGIAVALGLTRVMTALLYETEPGDPATLAHRRAAARRRCTRCVLLPGAPRGARRSDCGVEVRVTKKE